MAYLVNITSRAERDLAHLYREINGEHSDAALKWYRGLKEAILSLEDHPNRCPVTPEKKQLRHELARAWVTLPHQHVERSSRRPSSSSAYRMARSSLAVGKANQ